MKLKCQRITLTDTYLSLQTYDLSGDFIRRLEDLLPVVFDDKKGAVRWINQRKRVFEITWEEGNTVQAFENALKELHVRGAPTIGVFAAYAVASLACNVPRSQKNPAGFIRDNAKLILRARPTAVNLSWAVGRMLERMNGVEDPADIKSLRKALLAEAKAIDRGEYESGKRIGKRGSFLIHDGDTVFTRCNTGPLACAGSGTAYAVIRKAWEEGKEISVVVPQTAPQYQGRLTEWECRRDEIPVTLIADDMVAATVANTPGNKAFIVGADRILLNGDVANKIGTLQDAIVAKHFGIPFYVAAPTSTIDPVSKKIPIEMRNPEEVKVLMGELPITAKAAKALNPAFDITPHSMVSGIITEKGVAREPYTVSLKAIESQHK